MQHVTPIASVSLLPCAHCGYLQSDGECPYPSGKWFVVACHNCGAQVDGDTPEEAITKWNRRSPPSVPVSKLEELAAKWKSLCGNIGPTAATLAECADELTALITEAKS